MQTIIVGITSVVIFLAGLVFAWNALILTGGVECVFFIAVSFIGLVFGVSATIAGLFELED